MSLNNQEKATFIRYNPFYMIIFRYCLIKTQNSELFLQKYSFYCNFPSLVIVAACLFTNEIQVAHPDIPGTIHFIFTRLVSVFYKC